MSMCERNGKRKREREREREREKNIEEAREENGIEQDAKGETKNTCERIRQL